MHCLAQGWELTHCDSVTNLDISEAGDRCMFLWSFSKRGGRKREMEREIHTKDKKGIEDAVILED